jgi:ATP-dependent protease ClpP protease subunit
MENETLGTSDDKDFFEITKKPITKFKYSIYIKDSIKEAKNMATLLGVFRSASSYDEITVYLNSSGGWLNTAEQILNAMEDCSAKIITVADGRVASAATLVFMAGDERIIKSNAYFMFHHYSAGVSGKGHEMVQKINFQSAYYPDLLKKYYKEIFTDEEVKEILEGKDVWMSGKDFQKKLDKMKKLGEENERSSGTSKKTSGRSSAKRKS